MCSALGRGRNIDYNLKAIVTSTWLMPRGRLESNMRLTKYAHIRVEAGPLTRHEGLSIILVVEIAKSPQQSGES